MATTAERLEPAVSVVIPTYNYARFLPAAVDSALAQTQPPVEIIVVDDGSKDNTRAVMDAYRHHPLVRYLFQENRGLSGARNTGIRAARGPWVALLDADDIWHPEKLAKQRSFVRRFPDVAVVATDIFEIDEAGHRLGANDDRPSPAEYEEYSIRDLLEFSGFRPSSVLLSKTAAEAAGLFDERMRYVEDLDLWVRLAARRRILRLNEPLTGFRNHPAVQSMHTGPNLHYHQLVLAKLAAEVPELRSHPAWRRRGAARMYVHVSWMHYCDGYRWGACRDVLRSVCQWPFALRNSRRARQRFQRAKRLVRYALFPPPAESVARATSPSPAGPSPEKETP